MTTGTEGIIEGQTIDANGNPLNDLPPDLIFPSDGDEPNLGASGQGNSDSLKQIAALEAKYAELEQKHKSLQGQYREQNPNQLNAQIQELQSIVLNMQQQRAAPASKEEPGLQLSEGLKNAFGDSATEFEQLLNAAVNPYRDGIAALSHQVKELQRQIQMAPISALQASDTDGVFQDPAYDEYMREKNELGLSRIDVIKSAASSDSSRLANLTQLSKANFIKAKAAKAAGAASTEPQLAAARKISPSGQGQSTTQTQGSQTSEATASAMREEYRKLLAQDVTQENVQRRLALRSTAAIRGIKLTD
jgi:hypothetical protein